MKRWDRKWNTTTSLVINETSYLKIHFLKEFPAWIHFSAFFSRIEESSIPYCGVDWSATAQSTNHCWFLLPSRKSYSRNVCKYPECITIQSRKDTSLVQCGCCMLIVHESHLLEESERQNLFKNIRKCRSSFTENSLVKDDTYLDQHAWSNVPSLKQPCMFCGRKRSLQSHIKRTQAYTVSIPDQNPCEYVHTSNNSFSSNYFICLWCSRCSHGSCLKNLDSDSEIKCECDYGRFRLSSVTWEKTMYIVMNRCFF